MINTKKQNSLFRLVLYLSSVFISLLGALFLFTMQADATSITQSYNSSSTIQDGIIVQLVPNNSSSVEPVSIKSIKQAFGVAINGSATTITLSNSSSVQQVYVVNSGNYQVLVSNENGNINTGDYITVSNINGVGMKADSSQPIIVGQALQSFSGKDTNLGSQTIKDGAGKPQTVQLGLINVRVSIAQNPLLKTQPTPLPSYLQKFSFYAVGKVVSPLRIYLGVAILVIILIISASMVYAAAKSSLISLGRNPLSKKVITKGFLELVLIAIIILISGVFGVYLLLKV